MPLVTRASAADLTRSSLTLQAKRFQLFQPMGGVRARPFSRAWADGMQKRIPKKRESERQSIFFIRVSMKTFLLENFQGAERKVPAFAGTEDSEPDERKNHGRRKRLLRGGGGSFCGRFGGIDDDGLFSALCGSGVDGAQVDALGGKFVQILRKSAGFVGQIESFRGSLLIRDSGRVESFLGTTGVIDDELNGAGGTLGGTQERENIHSGVAESFRDGGDRAGVIIKRDGELLGFGHVGTSCRCEEIIRPDGLGGSDTADFKGAHEGKRRSPILRAQRMGRTSVERLFIRALMEGLRGGQRDAQCAAAFPVSAEAIAEPMGLPKPVQGSQPGLAENVPLLPVVMSWNVPGTGAAWA